MSHISMMSVLRKIRHFRSQDSDFILEKFAGVILADISDIVIFSTSLCSKRDHACLHKHDRALNVC